MRHQYVEETKHRSNLRLALGKTYYSLRRYSQWPNYRPFEETFEEEPLKYEQFSHRTPLYRYEIVERDHEMRAEYWGGFSRHNALYRLVWPANDAAADSAAGVMTDASAAVRERSLRDREPESTNNEASLHAEDPLAEEFVTENHVLMMYSPFLESS